MNTLSVNALTAQLHWRYATKQFDPSRTIAPDVWQGLEDALVLSPSSYGLQPWRFVVVTNAALKSQLRPVSWNQSQITDCSHLVVFAARTKIVVADIDHFIARSAAVRGTTPDSLAGYRGMMIKDVVEGPRSQWAAEWAARQCYIALGGLMSAAAVIGVDACPLEGIEPAAYDQILDLPKLGYHVVMACALGYRAAADRYATAPKIRFPATEVVIHHR